MTVLASRCPPY